LLARIVSSRVTKTIGSGGVIIGGARPELGHVVLPGEQPGIGSHPTQLATVEVDELERLYDLDLAQLSSPQTSSGSPKVSMKAPSSVIDA